MAAPGFDDAFDIMEGICLAQKSSMTLKLIQELIHAIPKHRRKLYDDHLLIESHLHERERIHIALSGLVNGQSVAIKACSRNRGEGKQIEEGSASSTGVGLPAASTYKQHESWFEELDPSNLKCLDVQLL